jgi:paraquat-inducible protein A
LNESSDIRLSRPLLVRGLIVASLALLIAGAVTPLLTTERFYFFSNTFSLASGLRQLVANDQILIAAVVVLFSLCVPIVKAVVIWIAASAHAPRGFWLVLADRFGKWSMLEVFIAALLIVALKLGPIVDATLHYGAWLLAASVLLGGIASQMLAHEPHAGPLFSSPVTLTIGAVGGAVAATVLIGLMNPGLLRFEAIVGTPETRCVKRTLDLERLYAGTSATQSEFVAGLQSIVPANCPEAFRDAFEDYIEAWVRLEALDTDTGEEPSWLDRAAARLGLIATRDDRLADIEEAWDEIARIALDHGVTAPEK